jgi:ABC-2 type transport system permease protein
VVALAMIAIAIFMHAVAFAVVARFAAIDPDAGRGTLVVVTGCTLLGWSLMMSQAMESVTRAFYARSDLDLILSSPAEMHRVFTVRIAAIAVSSMLMALLLAAPFVNVLIMRGGLRWLSAYGVVLGVGAVAAAMSVALSAVLFRPIGPRRTRLAAQVVAAVVGAMFVIGLQVAAILSYGTISYFAFLQSDRLAALVPDIESALWWPARAVLGDPGALFVVVTAGTVMLVATIVVFSTRFGEYATVAAGTDTGAAPRHRRFSGFRHTSARGALRRKEWMLLRRDPWLASQTLMQLLYLLPPALMLWRVYGQHHDDLVLLVPVLVMASGQLAGGLAWLAISGEDAPDLVASAPIPFRWIVRAKIEAVTGAVALVFMPLVAALALASPRDALAATTGIVAATLSATVIQLWFRTQAKRKQFRRRQTSSRIATITEALSSIAWAATAGLAAAGHWQALVTAAIALGIICGARTIRPRGYDHAN